MVRNVKARDAEALVRICKTALKHETDILTIKKRIQELTTNDSYYIAIYEDDHDHRVLGFIQAQRYNLLYAGNGWTSLPLRLIRKRRDRVLGKAAESA